MGQFIDLIRMTIKQWTHDKVSLLGAAVAFYMVFSLAPMLIIAIRIAGAVFGQQAAEGQIVEHAREIIGQAGAEAVQLIIRNASQTQLGTAGTIFTVVLLVVASTTFFTQLQSALNTVWNVEQKPREIPGTVQHVLVRRLIGLLLVFAFSLLLILSMLTSAVLSSLQNSVDITFPGGQLFWQFINFGISLAVITVMIGVTYKTLPDIKIQSCDWSLSGKQQSGFDLWSCWLLCRVAPLGLLFSADLLFWCRDYSDLRQPVRSWHRTRRSCAVRPGRTRTAGTTFVC
jgi:membrane protein